MSMKYLDQTGLAYFWGKIKAYVQSVGVNPADFVVDEGSTTISNTVWFYRKWNSGAYECWGRNSAQKGNISTAWGGLYYGTLTALTYPITFVGDYPKVQITVQTTNGGAWAVPNYSDYSMSNTGTIYLYRPTSTTNMSLTINVYARGKWK